MSDERGEQLVRLIEEDPEDVEAYRAYGDWPEEPGDPRSQLMGMQIVRERLTDRHRLHPGPARAFALSPDVRAALEKSGHRVVEKQGTFCSVQAIAILPDGTRLGFSDPRRGGTAAGE